MSCRARISHYTVLNVMMLLLFRGMKKLLKLFWMSLRPIPQNNAYKRAQRHNLLQALNRHHQKTLRAKLSVKRAPKKSVLGVFYYYFW